MSTYHVTFRYLEDKRDYGVYEANSADGAQRQALAQHWSNARKDWDFLQGCLTAKKVS